MSPPRLRLLVAGDLPLGRFPARLPPVAPGLDLPAVLRAVVDAALDLRPDAVVFAGALSDGGPAPYEAEGVLPGALARLADAGLDVLLVPPLADVALASRLAGERIRVLSGTGRWASAPLSRDGQAVGRLVVSAEAPLDDLPPADGITVGVLPGREAAGLAEAVAGAPVDAWIAPAGVAPDVLGGGLAAGDGQPAPLVLQPGPVQPLGPDQPGPHGAWLLTIDADGVASAEARALATVRYGRLDVALDGMTTASAARAAVLAALHAHAGAVHAEQPSARHVVLHVRLAGATPAFGQVPALADDLVGETVTRDGLTVRVDRVSVAARPDLDLAALADGSGPVAALARLALRLDAGTLTDADRALVADAESALHEARRARVFDPLARHARFAESVEAEALRRLQRQTFRLLDAALTPRDAVRA